MLLKFILIGLSYFFGKICPLPKRLKDKVYEELFQIYGSESSDKRPVEFEDLQQLEYMERVIKETMRLFPVVPVVARKLLEDFLLDGYNLPKGCGILISIFALHRNEKYWPDSLKFDPDRFLPERVEKRSSYTYMPFSVGPRNCIGSVYAMMSMKILLATLLRKYVLIKDHITPVKDMKVKADVLLDSAEPVTMRIQKRVK
ncbi:cytochrome P450 4g15-like [Belonocnema kinseyi]|uniref:cytochrome P450 4g15-like n=1 Tax=Belonocnema kinseyi TaxID=2817044 RepID=UPI00143D83D7|nr:cytochrome P450 4g15-like [Belonocnema kinseyi]